MQRSRQGRARQVQRLHRNFQLERRHHLILLHSEESSYVKELDVRNIAQFNRYERAQILAEQRENRG